MPVVRCKVGWESEGWSYIVIQGETELEYARVPSSTVVGEYSDSYLYIQINESGDCVLKDIRYGEYYFINFKIRDDQFVDDDELERAAKRKYDDWCSSVYREVT